jgi:hypothetical protein
VTVGHLAKCKVIKNLIIPSVSLLMLVAILPPGHFRLVPRDILTPGEVQKIMFKIVIIQSAFHHADRHFAFCSLPVSAT